MKDIITENNVHQTGEPEHKTGDTVQVTAHYYCTSGQHLDLNKGDLFPVCPNTGEVTIWMHSES
jgi:predicted RNA-binding Zn-ribbon protein involved in translation (DUF1610 family)